MFRCTSVLCLLAVSCWGLPNAFPRMIGGVDAAIEDFPYTASIDSIRYGHTCSAVIISSEWILTTVSCVGPWHLEYQDWVIRVGSSVKNNSGIAHSMADWVWHPKYDMFVGIWQDFNFALAKASSPFEFGTTTAAAPLPEGDLVLPDLTDATVVGWGKGYDYELPANLTYASLTLYDDTTCSILLNGSYSETKLCGRNANNDVAFCWDDEGGPLMVNGTLAGIILQDRDECSNPEQAQAFGRVASVRDWIDSIIGA